MHIYASVKKDFWSTEHLLSMRRSSLPGGSLDNCHLRSSYHTSCLLNYVTEADLKPYPKVWNPSHPLNFGGAREEPDDCDPSSLSAARAVCGCCSVVEGAFGRGCSRAVPVSSGLVKGQVYLHVPRDGNVGSGVRTVRDRVPGVHRRAPRARGCTARARMHRARADASLARGCVACARMLRLRADAGK